MKIQLDAQRYVSFLCLLWKLLNVWESRENNVTDPHVPGFNNY